MADGPLGLVTAPVHRLQGINVFFNYLSLAYNILTGVVILLHVLAPLTKWKGDDRLGQFLSRLQGTFNRAALNPAGGTDKEPL